jgi:hypothetical protein
MMMFIYGHQEAPLLLNYDKHTYYPTCGTEFVDINSPALRLTRMELKITIMRITIILIMMILISIDFSKLYSYPLLYLSFPLFYSSLFVKQ